VGYTTTIGKNLFFFPSPTLFFSSTLKLNCVLLSNSGFHILVILSGGFSVQRGLSLIEKPVGLGDLGSLTTPAMNLQPQHLRWMARSDIKSL
jgi:hypothetical protein